MRKIVRSWLVITAGLTMCISGFSVPAAAQTEGEGEGSEAVACAAKPKTRPETIEMSDGVKLSANVWLPYKGWSGPEHGRYPTILGMTPYGKRTSAPSGTFMPTTADCYVHVNVDIRGTGDSSGALCIFCEREQLDGKEVVEWVARQEWSDGSVGMIGGSYAGITALLTAAQHPKAPDGTEALKAIVPAHVMSDAYRDASWHNGMFASGFVPQWGIFQTAKGTTGRSGADETLADRKDAQQPMEARVQEWDGTFYRQRSVYTQQDKISTPTLLWAGWFDGFSRGTIRTFQGIDSEHKMLVVDPFGHHYGDPLAKPAALQPYEQLYDGPHNSYEPMSPYADQYDPRNELYGKRVRAWFDHFLKGKENGVEDLPDVTYHDLGAREWRTSAAWPPPGATTKELYLATGEGGSFGATGGGKLSPIPPTPEQPAADAYIYDPTAGGSDAFSRFGEVATTPQIRLDQKGEQAKALTYTTAASEEPLSLAGPMELRFWATTTAPNTDWVAKVAHVYPNGDSEPITSGYLRASHRAWDEARSGPAEPWITNERPGPAPVADAVPYVPTEDLSKPTEYRIDIWPTALTLPPGHRLSVTITSSDTPTHEPLPFPAVNTILHDKGHPSRLIVTHRPANVAPEAALEVTPETVRGNGDLTISGKARDLDGATDITASTVTITDAQGRLLHSWTREAFSESDAYTLAFTTSGVKLSGLAPWSVVIEVQDSAGHTASTVQYLDR